MNLSTKILNKYLYYIYGYNTLIRIFDYMPNMISNTSSQILIFNFYLLKYIIFSPIKLCLNSKEALESLFGMFIC